MMSDHHYIDYFSELKGKPRSVQLALLGEARYEIFVKQKQTGKATLILVFTFLVYFAFLLVATLSLSNLWLQALSVGVVFYVGHKILKSIYGKLLHRGLMVVLNGEVEH